MKRTLSVFGLLTLIGVSWGVSALSPVYNAPSPCYGTEWQYTNGFFKLIRPNMRRHHLVGVDLKGADLKEADLTNADLTGANLKGADLTGAVLLSANLTGAKNFNTADMTGAIFCKTIMPDASLNKSGC